MVRKPSQTVAAPYPESVIGKVFWQVMERDAPGREQRVQRLQVRAPEGGSLSETRKGGSLYKSPEGPGITLTLGQVERGEWEVPGKPERWARQQGDKVTQQGVVL